MKDNVAHKKQETSNQEGIMINWLKIIFVFFVVSIAQASDDTYVKIQEMVNDLGVPQYRQQNNGKVQQCADGGTKQITIKKTNYGTSYKSIYRKCKEFGTLRDGHVEITTEG